MDFEEECENAMEVDNAQAVSLNVNNAKSGQAVNIVRKKDDSCWLAFKMLRRGFKI